MHTEQEHRGHGKCWCGVPRPKVALHVGAVPRAAFLRSSLVFVAKAQKIEMDKLEKAKKERTKVSDG